MLLRTLRGMFCGWLMANNSTVVFLAHRNPDAKTAGTEALACGNCQNKAWTAIYEASGDGFPRLRCTCCGWDGGRFGWVDNA